MQRRTSPKNQIYDRMFSCGFRHALAGKLFAVFKQANRTWRLTKGTSKKSNNGNRQCQIKLNDWRLHKAAQIYRTCNWKEMQSERGLARFGHTRLPIIAAARFPIGRRTMPIVNELNTCSQNSVMKIFQYHKTHHVGKLNREGGISLGDSETIVFYMRQLSCCFIASSE